ncbi:hypothetical protein ACJIZ3_007141 [Penstemon smallii]|uniref:Uncharacterized protein n=1 Tax=Penstemon smallii TaxID=265156 RepID=A0ABD3S9X4_9LAMI
MVFRMFVSRRNQELVKLFHGTVAVAVEMKNPDFRFRLIMLLLIALFVLLLFDKFPVQRFCWREAYMKLKSKAKARGDELYHESGVRMVTIASWLLDTSLWLITTVHKGRIICLRFIRLKPKSHLTPELPRGSRPCLNSILPWTNSNPAFFPAPSPAFFAKVVGHHTIPPVLESKQTGLPKIIIEPTLCLIGKVVTV